MERRVPTRTRYGPGRRNGLRYLGHTSCQWRDRPHDLPPWLAVYQQWQLWCDTHIFGDIVHDLNELRRVLLDRAAAAVIFDGPGLRSTFVLPLITRDNYLLLLRVTTLR